MPAWFVLFRLRCPGPLGSCSPVRPLGALLCWCGVLSHWAPLHWCTRVVCCVASAVPLATWLLFTGALARCVALLVRCPGPFGSRSPVCPLGVLCCLCGVLGHLPPVHWCARSVLCFACALSWATWLLFSAVPARCVVLRLRRPGQFGSCSPGCPLGVLCRVCGVPGHLAPVHRCARSVRFFARAVSSATWLLFTGVPARCVVLLVRCPGPLGSCSPLCVLRPLLCLCGVLGHLAPVHRCASWVRCVSCAVSWVTGHLFTRVPARCVALRVQWLGPLSSCSRMCPCGLLCSVCGVLGHLAPVHRCARWVCCVACAVSWVTGHLFTGVRAPSFALLVWCPGQLGSCSPVCPLRPLLCSCAVLGHLTPVHRRARSVCCVACAVSWATWLLFTDVRAPSLALLVPCPGPLGSCSPVCPLGVLCCLCLVLGHLAPVHRCAGSVRCFACGVAWAPLAPVHGCARVVGCVPSAVSWATWLLLTGAPARWVALLVRCPGPLRSCSPMCPLSLLCCMRGVLGHLPPVHRCARSVLCFACAVSWATWLLFTGVPAPSVTFLVRCPRPLGSCSPLCPLGVLCCLCGVLGHLAPVHRCARSVPCYACSVSWGTWLMFTGVPAQCVALCVQWPGPLSSCSRMCPCGLLCSVRAVLGHLAPVHRCVRSMRCFAGAVSWATWLLFTGVPAGCVVLLVRCPGSLGTCSPGCPLGALLCICAFLGHLAPVHRCARVVCCVASAVSWATWLLFTGALARCVALLVQCPSHLVRAHWCARSMCCVARPVSWATCLLFTCVRAPSFALLVQCPGPLGSCSLLCPLGALCCACSVLGHVARVHRGAHSVYCVACAVSQASWPLFTRVPAPSIALLVRCPRPLDSCSPVCPLGVLSCVCGVLGHLPPVQRCARSVLCFACALSWAMWLLFTGVPAPSVTLLVRCPRPLGSCSSLCRLGVLCCLCGVLGHLAPVHRCARSLPCFACSVSLATWLLFTGVPARCVVLLVRCPGPLGSCSPVCPLCVFCCACGFLGLLAAVHRCASSVCCVACTVSWATCLLFTAVLARCALLGVRCPGPLCSCSPVCSLGVLCCGLRARC